MKTTGKLSSREKRELRQQQETKRKRNRMIAASMPALFFYYDELVLKASTVNRNWNIDLLYIFLFSLGYGAIVWFLSSLSRNEKANRRIRTIAIVLVTVLFCIFYFVYLQFKVFYDLNTVFAGAGDAVGEFQSLIFSLIFSARGVTRLLLFWVPVVLYLKFRKRFDDGLQSSSLEKFLNGATAVIAIVLNLLLISMNPLYWNVYSDEYNFQNAVTDFGLLSAFRMDLVRNADSEASLSFETVAPEVTPEASAEASEEPIAYGYSEMDIDFEALEQTGTSAQQELDRYVSSLTPTKQNEYTGLFKGKNLIFISAEAFSGDIIDPDLTPTLYRLASKGIQFTDYYQPASAGTTGGECENLFGLMPTKGGSSVKITADYNNYFTMGNQLNRLNYNGWAFHNNDYTFYSRNLTHNNLGYSNGFMGYGNGMENYVTSQWPQSDLEMMEGTVDFYLSHQPFNVYYMSVSGHNPYSVSGNAMSAKHWDEVSGLDQYNDEVKAYIASQLELEDALTYLVNRLEQAGIADDTVIVLSADHFPYGLDYDESLENSTNLDNLYGYTVTNYLERDHNRLILWSGCLEDMDPIVVDTPVSSIDILPTLSNLFGTEWDSRLLPGRDVFSDAEPLVFNMNYDWKTDQGYYLSASGKFYPNEGVTVSDDYVDRIRTLVRNKINYCNGVLSTDYYAHVFGSEEPAGPSPIPTPALEPESSADALPEESSSAELDQES
ncbi:MAG: sulfatase-like hydrolase/transferase [Solobacterium sp.]|jgi:lipoteichoic acid synthase|nr:sulfatase-like hydrolase/transferase [Solobacterium sp.]